MPIPMDMPPQQEEVKPYVCLISQHPETANHFAEFSTVLDKKGVPYLVLAGGEARKIFDQHKVSYVDLASLASEEGNFSSKTLTRLVTICSTANEVICGVGDLFFEEVFLRLQEKHPTVIRTAYYDNPDPFVPGGYSQTAAKVIAAAQRVLFANASLARMPLFSRPNEEIPLEHAEKVGLGYYPLETAETIRELRSPENTASLRRAFFKTHGLEDNGEKILTYLGGANEVYFNKAFPRFMQIVTQLAEAEGSPLANTIVVLQQHPRARQMGSPDAAIIEEAKDREILPPADPLLLVSQVSTEEGVAVGDVTLYYQTRMAPQVFLGGVPTIQIGQERVKDVLVSNGLISAVTTPEALQENLKQIFEGDSPPLEKENLKHVKVLLGIHDDWSDRLLAHPKVSQDQEQ